MKTTKYKIFGRHIALFAILLMAFLVLPRHAFASAPPAVSLGTNFSFIDSQHIQGSLNGKSVIFYDKNPGDTTRNYSPQDLDSGTYCNPTKYWGINISKDANLSAPSVSGTIILGYQDTNGNSKSCSVIPSVNNKSISVSNSGSAASAGFIWQDKDIVSSDGSDTYTAVTTNTNNGRVYIDNDSAGSCDQKGVIITDGPSSGTLYALGTAINGRAPAPGTAVPDPPASYLSGSCRLLDTKKITISGSQGTTPPTASGGSQSSDSSSNTGSCESNFISPFSWFVCPSLNLIDGIIGAAYGQVENQLCFNTGKTSTTGGVICDTTDSLGDGVKTAWNIFKNIASALLVIVMLVMVLSQAIGGGPFDAYTVRKMLPKLVAAVIIMQLSYVLLRYAIDLSNDAGMAIGSLIMAPFGGPDNMSLADMVGRAVTTAAGDKASIVGSITQTGFDLFATVAAAGAFIYAIPALPLLGLYVLIGVFVAFFTLVIRKLLIIMLVILAPLAFIAWLLPGTERYWKLWRENITKLLVMFPLVMAMLSAGRIFAYITSKAGNGASMFNPHFGLAHLGPLPVPYMASPTGFANLAIIIIAYFAPYFLLPKTFSWGGQLLGQVGRAVEQYSNKGSEPAKKFLKNREESYRGERRRKSQIRVSRNTGFNILKPWQKPIDSFRSGQWDPTLGFPGSHRRQTTATRYSAQGAEEVQKEIKEADLRADLLFDQVDDHDGLARAMAAGDENYVYTTLDGETHRLGKLSDAERIAGLNGVAKFGGGSNFRFLDREIEIMRRGNAEEQAMAKSFLSANSSTLIGKMKHFYYGPERDKAVSAMVGSMTDNSFVGMEGAEMEAILESLTHRVAAGDAGAATDLQRVLTFYESAINNENIRPNISSGVNQAIKALADPVTQDKINQDIDPATGQPRGRARWGQPGIVTPAGAVAAPVIPLVTALNGRIDAFGKVT